MNGDREGGETTGFLTRWSREKAKTRETEVARREERRISIPEAKTDSGAVVSADGRARPEGHANLAPDRDREFSELPPLESLTKDSDFTGFLADGVPDDLRKKALRRLWDLDPIFGTQCKLDVFIDDYTKIVPIDIAKDTIYKVGLGFCEPEDFMTDEEKEEHRQAKAAAVRRENVEGRNSGEATDTNGDVDSPGTVAGSDDVHEAAEVDSKIPDASSEDAESVPVVSQRKLS